MYICYQTQILYNSVSHTNHYKSTAHYPKPIYQNLSINTSVNKHNSYIIQSHTLTTITVQPIIPNRIYQTLSICTSVTKHNSYIIQSHTLTTITVQPIIPNPIYQILSICTSVTKYNSYTILSHTLTTITVQLLSQTQSTKRSQYVHLLQNTIPIQFSLTH
jgi:hypothetical protein